MRNSSHAHLYFHRGITRLEICIVVIIVSLLGLYIGEKVSQKIGSARQQQVATDLQRIAAGLHQYKLDNKRYPTEAQGLRALLEVPTADPLASRWNGPYLSRDSLLIDPWGRDYIYRASDAPPTFTLQTLGGDGKEGGEGGKSDTILKYQSSGI